MGLSPGFPLRHAQRKQYENAGIHGSDHEADTELGCLSAGDETNVPGLPDAGRGLGHDYIDPPTRKPVWRWPNEIPIAGEPANLVALVEEYNRKLQQSALPKLLFTVTPGALITAPVVDWCQQNLSNLKVVDLGPGIHFVQEDNPHLIGTELAAMGSHLQGRLSSLVGQPDELLCDLPRTLDLPPDEIEAPQATEHRDELWRVAELLTQRAGATKGLADLHRSIALGGH